MSYKIVENFLPEDEFENIKNVLLGSSFPWYFSTYVATANDNSDKYFLHTLYENNTVNSDYFYVVNPILQKLDVKALCRIKANLYVGSPKLIEHAPHTDFLFTHSGFILYLNTNDGYTKLADGTKIASIANRGLFFNPMELHSSTNCTTTACRANITINYF